MKNSLALARRASFLALLCYFLSMYLSLTLFDFLPPASKGVSAGFSLANFLGIALGAALCPVFLPTPKAVSAGQTGNSEKPGRKNRPLFFGMVFIFLIALPQIVIRSLGLEFWIDSLPIRLILTVNLGMLLPLCYGLFFLSRLCAFYNEPFTDSKTRTDRFCPLFFSFALIGAILVRYFSVPLLEIVNLAADPQKARAFLSEVIKWLIISAALFSALCLVLLKPGVLHVPHFFVKTRAETDWPAILRLVGLSAIINALNGAMEMRLSPLVNYAGSAYKPFILIVAIAVPLLALFAGRSINRILRWLLPPAIILFIMLPCLTLFESYPWFTLIMSTLVSIFRFSVWVIFTTAVVELYAGGLCFYGITVAIYFTNVFTFFGLSVGPVMPTGIEFTVPIMGVATVLFMLLSFRVLFPKIHPRIEQPQQLPDPAFAPEDLFKRHGLSRREIEVGALLISEGLNYKEIGERLFISLDTVKDHISQIYRKFEVKSRAELMALFLRK